jgi:hypothetical protein
MAKLTIGRMAKLYSLHRSTLHEAVAKGRVNASFDGKGQKVIDLSEMIRVYGEPTSSALHRPTPSRTLPPTVENDALRELIAEVRSLREEIHELRGALRLIEHKPEAPFPSPVKTAEYTQPSGMQKEPATWKNLLCSFDE